jgi:hypothetical protein
MRSGRRSPPTASRLWITRGSVATLAARSMRRPRHEERIASCSRALRALKSRWAFVLRFGVPVPRRPGFVRALRHRGAAPPRRVSPDANGVRPSVRRPQRGSLRTTDPRGMLYSVRRNMLAATRMKGCPQFHPRLSFGGRASV